MRGNYRTDITIAVGAAALALFMVACNKQEKRETIKPAGAADKIQGLLKRMSGGKYDPFTAENRALADRVAGATLNMMIVDRQSGERFDLIDMGLPIQLDERETDTKDVESSTAKPKSDIVTKADGKIELKKKDVKVTLQKTSVPCANGKNCRRLTKVTDDVLDLLADKVKYELQIEVALILKNPNIILSAAGVVNTQTSVLANREGTEARFQISAGCVRERCKKVFVMLSDTDAGKVSQSALVFDLNKDRGQYTVAWAAHPKANDYTTSGNVRSALIVAKELKMELNRQTQLQLQPELDEQDQALKDEEARKKEREEKQKLLKKAQDEEAKKLEEQKKLDEEKKADEAKKLEEQKRAEEAKKLEEQKKADEAKKLEDRKKADEAAKKKSEEPPVVFEWNGPM